MIQFILQNNMPWCPEADLREFDTLIHSGKPLIAPSAELLTQQNVLIEFCSFAK